VCRQIPRGGFVQTATHEPVELLDTSNHTSCRVQHSLQLVSDNKGGSSKTFSAQNYIVGKARNVNKIFAICCREVSQHRRCSTKFWRSDWVTSIKTKGQKWKNHTRLSNDWVDKKLPDDENWKTFVSRSVAWPTSYNKLDHGWPAPCCLYRPWHYTTPCNATLRRSTLIIELRPVHTAKCTLCSRYISIMRRFRSERFSFPAHTWRNRRWSRDAAAPGNRNVRRATDLPVPLVANPATGRLTLLSHYADIFGCYWLHSSSRFVALHENAQNCVQLKSSRGGKIWLTMLIRVVALFFGN